MAQRVGYKLLAINTQNPCTFNYERLHTPFLHASHRLLSCGTFGLVGACSLSKSLLFTHMYTGKLSLLQHLHPCFISLNAWADFHCFFLQRLRLHSKYPNDFSPVKFSLIIQYPSAHEKGGFISHGFLARAWPLWLFL